MIRVNTTIFITVAIAIGLVGCSVGQRYESDSNVTVSGQYLGDIEKKEIGTSEGIFDFSAVNLQPTLIEEYNLPNRKQYNYLFRGTEGEHHWLFTEIADNGGFSVMEDAEFLTWVRDANGMQNAKLSDLDIKQRETQLGPVKYSYYFSRGYHCVGLAGIFGDPRDIDGYTEARNAAIYAEFCRADSNPSDIMLYSRFIIDRLKIRTQNG